MDIEIRTEDALDSRSSTAATFGERTVIPALPGFVRVAHFGSLAAGGNLHSDRLAGQAVALAGIADQDFLSSQIGHVHGAGAGFPGLAAVRGILHIRRGVQRLIIGVKDQNGSAGVVGDHHGNGPAGKVLLGGGEPEQDGLAQVVGGVQRLGEGGPGPAVVGGELHALVGADSLRPAVHFHLGSLAAGRNGHGHTAAGEGIIIAMVADDNGLPGQAGHVQGFGAGVPGLSAIGGVVHKP